MRQLLLVEPGRMQLVEGAPVPEPGEGMARIRIKAVGICGSDKHTFRDGGIGETRISEPFILGHEAMGVVDAVGSRQDEALIGKRVAIEPAISCGVCDTCLEGNVNLCSKVKFMGHPPTPGALQEFVVHPRALIEPVPDAISDDGAVILEPLGVVVHAFDLSKIRFSSRVAVLGCGTIGLLCVWMAAQLGAEQILATDLHDYRLQAARKLGATHVLNACREDVVATASAISAGKGFRYVFEAASSDDTAPQAVEVASQGAKISVIGISPSDRVSFCHATARRKGLTIFMVRRSRRTLERAIVLLEKNAHVVGTLVTHHADLSECEKMLRLNANYEDNVIKSIIMI